MIPCLNCGKSVEPDNAKLYAGCFVCADCYLVAERLFKQGQQELNWLLTVLTELIRLAIVSHRLQFNSDREQPRAEVLQSLAELAKNLGEKPWPKTSVDPTATSLKEIIPSSAPSAAKLEMSGSMKESDSTLGIPSTETTKP